MNPVRRLHMAALIVVGLFTCTACSTGRLHVNQPTAPPLVHGPVSHPATSALAAPANDAGAIRFDEPDAADRDTTGARLVSNQPATAEPRPLTRGFGADVTFADAAGADRDRHAALIGLYGELVSDSPDAWGQLDGGHNIAQVSFATEGACFDPSIDHTGTLLAFASTMHRPTSDLYLKSTAGRTITQLTTDPSDDVMPAFSPDGSRVAFASNRAGNWDVYVTSVEGGRPVQVTSDLDNELHPSWSPDGSLIAFCRYGSQSSRWEIWVVDVENPGIRQFVEYGLFPQWCPDVARSKLLFQRARQRGSRYHAIWTVDYRNGEALHPTEIISASNAAVINPDWSADGRRIVFVTVAEPEGKPGERPTRSDVWVVNADGTNRISLTNGRFSNYQPVWGSDGTVYFVSNRSGIDNIWAVATSRSLDILPGGGSDIATVDPAQQQP